MPKSCLRYLSKKNLVEGRSGFEALQSPAYPVTYLLYEVPPVEILKSLSQFEGLLKFISFVSYPRGDNRNTTHFEGQKKQDF